MNTSKLRNYNTYADMRPTLVKLDQLRIRWMIFLLFLIALSIIYTLTFALWFDMFNDYIRGNNFDYLYISLFVILMILYVGRLAKLIHRLFVPKLYDKMYNATIIELIKRIDGDIVFFAKESIPESEFENANLFGAYNKYKGKHFFFIPLDEVDVACCTLSLNESYGGGRKSYNKELFEGLLFIFDLENPKPTSTLIYPKATSEKAPSNHYQPYYTNNDSFDSLFRVYTNNQQEASEQLTSKALNNILRIKNTYDIAPFVSLSSKKLFIALPRDMQTFKPSLFKSITSDMQIVDNFIEELDMILKMPVALRGKELSS